MNRTEFETQAKADGYEIVDREMAAGHVNPEHSHEFDARLLMLEGEMTVTYKDGPVTYRAGETCALEAGTPHAEQCGASGARYLAARRFK